MRNRNGSKGRQALYWHQTLATKDCFVFGAFNTLVKESAKILNQLSPFCLVQLSQESVLLLPLIPRNVGTGIQSPFTKKLRKLTPWEHHRQALRTGLQEA